MIGLKLVLTGCVMLFASSVVGLITAGDERGQRVAVGSAGVSVGVVLLGALWWVWSL